MWSVYTDFDFNDWNKQYKNEYAQQVKDVADKVLYVNPYCLDKYSDEKAKGGADYFSKGEIIQEISAGQEGVLSVKII